jgi:protein-L-isoaspartate(D-aspartate) O-methyltransferase
MNPSLLLSRMLNRPASEPGPSGCTLDPAEARAIMVETQIAARGLRNVRVLEAIRTVPRHEFVPERWRDRAHGDHPIAVGFGQTISQPYIVAFMTEQLDPQPTDRILEVGMGSGYQAAVLSRLVQEVFTIEIVEPLAVRAAADLERLGFQNVQVRVGDGYRGWPEAAPFDAIVVACAPDHVPEPLVGQLKEGGRMIVPLDRSGAQTLCLLEKRGGQVEQQAVLEVRFVPMTGESERR